MELLKSFKLHGSEIKMYKYWDNSMRVMARNPEGVCVSFTCPFNHQLEETQEVKNFLKEYFTKEAIID
jgi:hypothetical protein